MGKRSDYEQRVRAKLSELEQEVDKLKEQIRSAEEELLPQEREKFEGLHRVLSKGKDKLTELLQASDEVWEGMEDGIERYYKALGNELMSYQMKRDD